MLLQKALELLARFFNFYKAVSLSKIFYPYFKATLIWALVALPKDYLAFYNIY